MAKDKLTEYDATAANNTVVGDVNLAENSCLPSDLNNAVREVMSHLKEFADGTNGINVLSLADDDASAAIKFQAPSTVTSTTTFTLPDGDGDSGQTLITNGSGALSWHAPYGSRNLVINGNMTVAQRSTSETGQGASSGYTTLDRFRHEMGGDATAGRFTISQNSVTDLSGFSKSLKIQCTTADTSTAASEGLLVQQRFEGQDLQRLKNSSTSTKAFTLSFYAKQNETRNIVVEIRTSQGTNRQICKLFSVTNSWARYEFTVPAQASGMTINDDNSNELQINFWLHAGSTFTGGTLDTSFAGSTNANRAVGVGSIFASTSNFIEITGVQLEVGEQATPFEHRSFGDELVRCQRYHTRIEKASGQALNSSQTVLCGVFPVEMRTTPTASLSAALTIFQLGVVGSKGQSSSNISVNTDINSGSVFNAECGNFSSLTTHQATAVAGGTQPLIFDAEL